MRPRQEIGGFRLVYPIEELDRFLTPEEHAYNRILAERRIDDLMGRAPGITTNNRLWRELRQAQGPQSRFALLPRNS